MLAGKYKACSAMGRWSRCDAYCHCLSFRPSNPHHVKHHNSCTERQAEDAGGLPVMMCLALPCCPTLGDARDCVSLCGFVGAAAAPCLGALL